jgi:hypothetical protein
MTTLLSHSYIRLTRSLLCGLLVFLLSQGQWMLLQGVAWMEMLQDAERGETLVERFGNTFSGTAPCELCVVVQTGLHGEPEDTGPASASVQQDDFRLIYTLLTPEKLDAPWVNDLSFVAGGLLPGSAVADPPSVPPPILG